VWGRRVWSASRIGSGGGGGCVCGGGVWAGGGGLSRACGVLGVGAGGGGHKQTETMENLPKK